MQRASSMTTLAIALLAVVACNAQDGAVEQPVSDADRPYLLNYPNLDDPDGVVVLSNDLVVLQRLVVGAGEWEGIHSHPGNQIYVHIKGGEWSGRLGGRSEYDAIVSPDGEVGWMDAIPLSAGHESGNTGDTAIDLIYVTLKDEFPVSPEAAHEPQAFPDIPLERVLENDRMIVQRAIIEPGQWTGVHGRPGNQVFVVIKGGAWAERSVSRQTPLSTHMPDGSVGWLDAIDLRDGYEMGNTGDTTIEYVLVTIK